MKGEKRMYHAKCVKPCPFAYGGCQNRGVKVHPRYTTKSDLLKGEDGEYYCHNGQFLTIYSDICEKCGDRFKPAPHLSTEERLAYQCPTCSQVITKEV